MTAPSPATPTPPTPRILSVPVLSWGLWDWGSAAFNSVATTFVFSVYLTTPGLFADGDGGTGALSMGLLIAGIVVAIAAPITGQQGDRRGRSHLLLAFFTALVVISMLAMFFVYPTSPLGSVGALWLGVALLGFGNIFFEFASVNYNAMLPRISTRQTMGRVSGLGWGLGYIGGIILLALMYVGFIAPEVGWFGITAVDYLNIRVVMVISAVWFAVFAIPVLAFFPHRPADPAALAAPRETLPAAYRRLWSTVRSLARVSPPTLKFMVASAIFRDGLAGVFTYGAIIAAGTFHMSQGDILIFGIVANVVAGLFTIGCGPLDDWLGPKRVIVSSLILMVGCGIAIFVLHDAGTWVFWVFGLVLSSFVGPVQAASRSLLGRLVPEGHEGEVFGLYATTGRAVSFLSPAFFASAMWFGGLVINKGESSQYFGILGIVIILLAGAALTAPLSVGRRGDRHVVMDIS
ncbi:MFS transporter [Nanchangia anserum]|uniref:MFS transporter n=1 Tax=Nanchangia anserum TaxID=2692125 RepID=A0A8I0KW01_9ACTO|nr:MFS transporter [Nanchangia anserum]MBD3689484.1 MFS transporter [Nanchangia anserum]QOX81675.1 MFS transporter [Nanchangia anserum]